MNPETEKNINEAIDWLQSTGGSIQDFAAEQAPLYCREVVQWELWSSAIGASIGILLLIGTPLAVYINRKTIAQANEDMDPTIVVPWMLFTIMGVVVGLVFTGEELPDLIKAITAPRLVIVEHLRSLK
jgi:hypothetical protein